MRGMLRIRSERAPYLRAGLGWSGFVPNEVDIRDLDGARLLELVRDPVLTIHVSEDGETFRPMPQLPDDIDAEQLQLMIDSLASQLPPRDGDDLEPDEAALFSIDAAELTARGFATVEQLLAAIDNQDAEAAKRAVEHGVVLADLATARGQVTELSGKLEKATIEITERDQVIDNQKKLLADASAEIARLGEPAKAVAKPKTTKPKPADQAD
jgi:hypothetical protein